MAEQGMPVPRADHPGMWSLIIGDIERGGGPLLRREVESRLVRDMRERELLGRQRYGVVLQPNNGRDSQLDAYQEALDLCAYSRQKYEECLLLVLGEHCSRELSDCARWWAIYSQALNVAGLICREFSEE